MLETKEPNPPCSRANREPPYLARAPRTTGPAPNREPKTVEIAEEWAQDLAQAVVAVSRLIDPDCIVLGGSVAALYPMVAARVTHYIIDLQPSTFPMPDIEVHDAPATGASYGAACMMHERYLTGDLNRTSDGLLE